MRILLPPSETKKNGGLPGSLLDLAALGFSGLTPTRRKVLSAVRVLCRNRAVAAAALGISEKQYFEVERNREVTRSEVLPAIDRYTGVVYDALDAPTLPEQSRLFAGDHLVIHSALFGLLRALDPIPSYRLSYNSRIPELSLKRTWSSVISQELETLPGLIIDLRSESYVSMGPAPESSFFLRIVTVESNGTLRALNHFNKKAKGAFVREVLLSRIDHANVDSLLAWSADRGIRLDVCAPGELLLVI